MISQRTRAMPSSIQTVVPGTEAISQRTAAPARRVGFVTACSIVIANIIGTGIFTSLGFQLNDIQSGFALLMLWAVGGIAALCGALCYGELAAALPRSGGDSYLLRLDLQRTLHSRRWRLGNISMEFSARVRQLFFRSWLFG